MQEANVQSDVNPLIIMSKADEKSDNSVPEANNTAENEQVAENDQQVAENEQPEGEQQVAEGGQAQQAAPRAGGWAMFKTLLVRMVIIYMISSWLRKPSTPAPQAGDSPNELGKPGQAMPALNIYPKDTVMDLYVYISEQERFRGFDDPAALFWLEEELVYGDWTSGPNGDGSFVKSGKLPISEKVQNNGSIYMHVYLVRAGKSPNPRDSDTYEPEYTIYKTRKMNKLKKRKFHTMKNLITGQTDAHPDLIRDSNDTKVEILSHWHPNLTINIVDDHTPWVRGSVPAPLDEYIEFIDQSNSYYPILYFNDYWNLNQEFQPINTTTPVLNLTLSFHPLSLFRWQMYAAQSMRSRWYSFLGDDFMEDNDEDQDNLKQTLTDTNPYLLGITIVVSIVHSIFEFLAFKNDIQFWRNRKSLEGLSVRSVFFNVFQSLIVLLYVLDNETNFVVRVSVFIGLGIEIWKIHKVTDVKIDRENKILGIFPRIRFDDKATYTESMTKKYDMLAFKYLSWLLFPLLICYCVYSLLYGEHRGWYSWVLSMLYGFLLTFGFIMMTPQLFINYKLKSVAHLPWRMLTYKALNTFIDDLFAFVIKMPILYRIGCFRDDIVFLIYVYQRYIYPVDHKRVNEYGTSGEMEDQARNGTLLPPSDDAQPIEGTTEQEMADSNTAPKTAEEKKTD